jgi:hypothetical protein
VASLDFVLPPASGDFEIVSLHLSSGDFEIVSLHLSSGNVEIRLLAGVSLLVGAKRQEGVGVPVRALECAHGPKCNVLA